MVKISEEYVDGVLELSDNENSKLTIVEKELTGDNSPKLKSFLNNICAKPGTKYLELGVYRGASLMCALYGNLSTSAVGVENFSYDVKEVKKIPPKGYIWTNVQSAMRDRIKTYSNSYGNKVINDAGLKIIEEDFNKVEWHKQPKFDVINFDLLPITYENLDALFDVVIRKATGPECLVIINGYSDIQKSQWVDNTLQRYANEFEVTFKRQRVSSSQRDYFGYYSGVAILGIKKKAGADSKPAMARSIPAKSTTTITPPTTKSDK